MKANELMVGDYVFVKPSMLPIKVAAIHQKKVGYHATNKLYWVRMDLLEPIPLTNEILAKNFIKEEYRLGGDKGKVIMLVYSEDYYDISISEYSDSIYKVVVTNNEIFNTDEVCYVSYVHQLQQFLRLCGFLDKQIEL